MFLLGDNHVTELVVTTLDNKGSSSLNKMIETQVLSVDVVSLLVASLLQSGGLCSAGRLLQHAGGGRAREYMKGLNRRVLRCSLRGRWNRGAVTGRKKRRRRWLKERMDTVVSPAKLVRKLKKVPAYKQEVCLRCGRMVMFVCADREASYQLRLKD